MANNSDSSQQQQLPFALLVGVSLGILGGLLVGFSCEVIKVWPQPASVAPYFGFREGFVWGAVIGFVFGNILGFLTDDKHFQSSEL